MIIATLRREISYSPVLPSSPLFGECVRVTSAESSYSRSESEIGGNQTTDRNKREREREAQRRKEGRKSVSSLPLDPARPHSSHSQSHPPFSRCRRKERKKRKKIPLAPLSLDPIEHMQSADQSECGWVKRKGSSVPNKMVSTPRLHPLPPSPSINSESVMMRGARA